jgi:hypothetical protein
MTVRAKPNYQEPVTETIQFSGEVVEMQNEELSGFDLGDIISGQSTGTGVEYIPASAFRYNGFTGAPAGYRFVPTSGYIRNRSTGKICLAAPVYLPAGAVLNEFSIYIQDNDAVNNIGDPDPIYLLRQDLTAITSQAKIVVAAKTLNVADTTVRRWFIPISGETVSNNNSYFVAFCFNASTGFNQLVYGARVDYR